MFRSLRILALKGGIQVASICLMALAGSIAHAQVKGMPSLPTGAKGFSGSVGVGFTDFTVVSPSGDFPIQNLLSIQLITHGDVCRA